MLVLLFADEDGAFAACAAQKAAGVNLGGVGVGVAQFGLQLRLGHTGIQVQTGAHVAEIVGADVIHTGDGLDVAQDDTGEPLGGAACPVPIPDAGAELLGAGGAEEGRGVRYVLGAETGGKIQPDGGLGDFRELHAAELIALAPLDNQLAGFPIQIGGGEGEKFGVAQLSGQKQDDDGVIPGPGIAAAAVGFVVAPEEHDLPVRQDGVVGAAGLAGRLREEAAGDGVVFIPAAAGGVAGEVEEHMEADKILPHGVGGQSPLHETIPPGGDGGIGRVFIILVTGDEEVHEIREGAGVGGGGAGRGRSGSDVFQVSVGGLTEFSFCF